MNKIHCNNWDSDKPEYLTDVRTGKTLGRLMPRIDKAILDASPGIQSHSKPGGTPDVEMYDPDSVVLFALRWEERYGRTYPLAKTDA